MPFLKDSYFCLDCEWIGENSEHCEKCNSAALSLLPVWIESIPSTIPYRLEMKDGAVGVVEVSSLTMSRER